jgi:hypothetical protein
VLHRPGQHRRVCQDRSVAPAHGSLTADKTALAACERCSPREPNHGDSAHIKALGDIAMYLMQDDKVADDEAVEAADLNRWSSNATSSPAEATSAASASSTNWLEDKLADDGTVGVTDLSRWGAAAASFVAETTSATSLSELKEAGPPRKRSTKP